MGQIANEEELISEIHDSLHELINFVKGQVKFGLAGDHLGDADTTERGVFGRLLQLGLQLMCLYFSGLGDGDVGEIIEINGVEYKRGGVLRRHY